METKEKQKYYKDYLKQKKELRQLHANLKNNKQSPRMAELFRELGLRGCSKNER